jgi:ATP-dependent DNA helicase PIF1
LRLSMMLGTGKSLLLRHIIDRLRAKYAKFPDAVAITASTGMAATNIGGQLIYFTSYPTGFLIRFNLGMTLHSWGAIAPGTQDIDNLVSYIRVCKPALQRWKKVKVLIIDEGRTFRMQHLPLLICFSIYGRRRLI